MKEIHDRLGVACRAEQRARIRGMLSLGEGAPTAILGTGRVVGGEIASHAADQGHLAPLPYGCRAQPRHRDDEIESLGFDYVERSRQAQGTR